MTCDSTSFVIVYQSLTDDGWVITKGFVQWNSVYDKIDPCFRRASSPEPLDQEASA